MIIRCVDEKKLPVIHEILEKHFLEVPYLYANIQKYGIGNEHVQLWIDEIDGRICGIYLKYYQCLHFFSEMPDYPKDEFVDMVTKLSPKVIMLGDDFGKNIEEYLEDEYDPKPEYVVKLIPEDGGFIADDVLVAEEADFDEIADLLMSDEVYSDVYKRDELYNQLVERYKDGFGTAYIIRRNNKIVTAYIVNGECDKYYILGGLITHNDYRHQGLGQRILNHVLKKMNEEKTCIGFLLYNNIATIELHQKMGMNLEHFLRKYYRK